MTNEFNALLEKVMHRDGLEQLVTCLNIIEGARNYGWERDFSTSECIMCAFALMRPDMIPENFTHYEAWSWLADVHKVAVLVVWPLNKHRKI